MIHPQNAWTKKADFAGAGRYYATGFSINGKGYMGTGYSNFAFTQDMWEFTPGDSGGSGAYISAPSGLVSWWSGDKTASDVQGINNGVLKNGAGFTRGMVGPAFLFDGVDDVVKVSKFALIEPNPNNIGCLGLSHGQTGGTPTHH
jgi:hypothetical protein